MQFDLRFGDLEVICIAFMIICLYIWHQLAKSSSRRLVHARRLRLSFAFEVHLNLGQIFQADESLSFQFFEQLHPLIAMIFWKLP